MLDPFRDRPMTKRPKDEKKFSLKDKTDRTLFLVLLVVGLVIIAIITVLLILFLPELTKKGVSSS